MQENTDKTVPKENEGTECAVLAMTWQDIEDRVQAVLNEGFAPGAEIDLNHAVKTLLAQAKDLFANDYTAGCGLVVQNDVVTCVPDGEIVPDAEDEEDAENAPSFSITTRLYYGKVDEDGVPSMTPMAELEGYIVAFYDPEAGYTVCVDEDELELAASGDYTGEDIMDVTLADYIDMLEGTFVEDMKDLLCGLPLEVSMSIVGRFCEEEDVEVCSCDCDCEACEDGETCEGCCKGGNEDCSGDAEAPSEAD